MDKTKLTAEELLELTENAKGIRITEYIGKQGYVWKMILKAMEEHAQNQVEAYKEELRLCKCDCSMECINGKVGLQPRCEVAILTIKK